MLQRIANLPGSFKRLIVSVLQKKNSTSLAKARNGLSNHLRQFAPGLTVRSRFLLGGSLLSAIAALAGVFQVGCGGGGLASFNTSNSPMPPGAAFTGRLTTQVTLQLPVGAQLSPAQQLQLSSNGVTVTNSSIIAPTKPVAGRWIQVGNQRVMTDLNGSFYLAALQPGVSQGQIFHQFTDAQPEATFPLSQLAPVGQTPAPIPLNIVLPPPGEMNPTTTSTGRSLATGRSPAGGRSLPCCGQSSTGRQSASDGCQLRTPCAPGDNSRGCCLDYDGSLGDGQARLRDTDSTFCNIRANLNFLKSTCYNWSFDFLSLEGTACGNESAYAALGATGPGCWQNHKYRNCQNLKIDDFSLASSATVDQGGTVTLHVRNNTPANETILTFAEPFAGSLSLGSGSQAGLRLSGFLAGPNLGGDSYILAHYNDGITKHFEDVDLTYTAPILPLGESSATFHLYAAAQGLTQEVDLKVIGSTIIETSGTTSTGITGTSVSSSVATTGTINNNTANGNITTTANGTTDNGTTDNGTTNNGTTNNGTTNNGTTNNGTTNNGPTNDTSATAGGTTTGGTTTGGTATGGTATGGASTTGSATAGGNPTTGSATAGGNPGGSTGVATTSSGSTGTPPSTTTGQASTSGTTTAGGTTTTPGTSTTSGMATTTGTSGGGATSTTTTGTSGGDPTNQINQDVNLFDNGGSMTGDNLIDLFYNFLLGQSGSSVSPSGSPLGFTPNQGVTTNSTIKASSSTTNSLDDSALVSVSGSASAQGTVDSQGGSLAGTTVNLQFNANVTAGNGSESTTGTYTLPTRAPYTVMRTDTFAVNGNIHTHHQVTSILQNGNNEVVSSDVTYSADVTQNPEILQQNTIQTVHNPDNLAQSIRFTENHTINLSTAATTDQSTITDPTGLTMTLTLPGAGGSVFHDTGTVTRNGVTLGAVDIDYSQASPAVTFTPAARRRSIPTPIRGYAPTPVWRATSAPGVPVPGYRRTPAGRRP